MSRLVILDHPRNLHPEHYNDVANAPLAASLNTGYAFSVAERAGWNPTYLDYLSAPAMADEIAAFCLATDPEIILIHWVYAWDDGATVGDIIQALRNQGYDGQIGAFGLFPTLCHRELLEANPGLDFVLIGEFEETLPRLLHDGELSRPGISSRGGFPGFAPVIDDLDDLPQPADLGRTASLKHMNLASSRGCYGSCSFCFIGPYYNDSCWRGRSPASIVKEVESRRQAREVDHLYFVDPNFFGPGQAQQERAVEIAQGLKGMELKIGLEGRVNDIHRETIGRLADAGLESVFLGIESGSQSVLNRMKKGITPAQSNEAIRILRDCGIFVSVGFIMFEPDSGLEDLRTNLNFLTANGLLEHHDQTANML
ncbi:MAG: B12-binding domain-containing radical SAM protein, partial [Planctomycetota bacterium]